MLTYECFTSLYLLLKIKHDSRAGRQVDDCEVQPARCQDEVLQRQGQCITLLLVSGRVVLAVDQLMSMRFRMSLLLSG